VIHDSSGNEAKGFGVMVDGIVYQGRWAATGQAHSSAYRELVPILLAAQLLCTTSPPVERVLIVTTDNESMAYAINKGSCKTADSDCLPLLRALFDLAEKHKLYIVADWIPRELNQLMDDVSKDKSIYPKLRASLRGEVVLIASGVCRFLAHSTDIRSALVFLGE
jgi:hypothetical protein